jgi:CubicO group peptidase (beta-lactamase class C family)
MKYILIFLIPIVILIGCEAPESKQIDLKIDSEPSAFGQGEITASALEKKGLDTYHIDLEEGTFVFGEANQLTVDVVVTIFDPEGEKVSSFDSPARGPEMFHFDTESSGRYKIEVEPFEDEHGEYTMLLKIVEPTATDPIKRVDQIMAPYDGDDIPGGVVAVVKDGEMIFSKAYGMSHLTHDIPFTTETPTNIGSVSKQFTAFAILLLEQQGKISLEDNIRKYLPELPDFADSIKVKNLLNHTNGLREIYNIMPISGWKGEDDLRREEAIHIIQRQSELQASPGAEFNYNNTAFIFLAEIVERITEQKFPDWMKENVFEPLGMDHTLVRDNPKQPIPMASMGYSGGEDGFVESRDLAAAYGAGAIYTTAGDFGKWFDNFKDPSVGGEELISKLTTRGILNDGDTMSYALGIGVGDYKGLKRYQHGGADIAHRAMLAYYPELDIGIVALSNNSSFPSGSIANSVADVFLAEHMEPQVVEVEVEEGTVDLEILETYVGEYKADDIGLIIEYTLEDGALTANPQGQSSRGLKAINDSTFSYDGIEAEITFHKNEEGEVMEATHVQGGNDILLRRLDPYSPSLEELAKFNGVYFSEEVETFYEVMVKDSILIARHRNLEDIELSPTEENFFSGSAFFFNEVEFKWERGEVVGFYVSNGRTKNIEFLKQ